MKKRILVIDDEERIVAVIKELLEDVGFFVDGETDPFRGEQKAIAEKYDLIIIDLRLPGKDGAEITKNVISSRPDARILINTGYPGDPLAQQAIDAGALTLLKKPFELEKIFDLLK